MATTLTKTPLRQIETVKDLLGNEEAARQLAAVSAKHLSPERMMRTLASAIRTTPMLQQADPLSFLGATMTFASIGIQPNTPFGHGWLIPFRNNNKKIVEVQAIIGYRGYVELAWRSGLVKSFSAHVHYSDDPHWKYREGIVQELEHEPGPGEGEKLHAYAIVRLKDDGYVMAVLPWKQVLRVRDGSQGFQSAVKWGKESPWITHEDEMAKKTAVRALAKFMPMSVEMEALQTAMAVDEAQPDFRAFALDPTAGITIEGEASLVDEDGSDDAAPDAGAKAPAQAKPAAAKAAAAAAKPAGKAPATTPAKKAPAAAKPAPEPDPEPEESAPADDGDADAEIPEEFNSFIEQVRDMLSDAKDCGEIEGALEMFADQIDFLQEGCPPAYAEIQRLADEARERVSG